MGVSGQRHAPAALYPRGKDPPVPIVQEAGWAPEPVWTQRLEEKSFAPAGDRTIFALDYLLQHYNCSVFRSLRRSSGQRLNGFDSSAVTNLKIK
jgi:hypothetical protein